MAFGTMLALLAMLAGIGPVEGVDPLTARIDDSAVQRFATVWRASGGEPTAAQLQAGYLTNGARGIEVFTPGRIVSADHLAVTIAREPQLYRNAVARCLPWLSESNASLRSSYLGLKGLFPERPLPQIAVVIGANNSGGTAAAGIQVIGLEVICRLSPTRETFDTHMREFFTHETVHTFQRDLSSKAQLDSLLAQALVEGVPDYVTKLVTGRVPGPDRDRWALAREAWVWNQFQTDAAIVRAGTDAKGNLSPVARAAFKRWFANAGDPPSGWPSELGYWVGMQIAQRYVANASDPHVALNRLLDPVDPEAILRASGYSPK